MSDEFGDKSQYFHPMIENIDRDLPLWDPTSSEPQPPRLRFNSVRAVHEAQDRYWHGMKSKFNALARRTDPDVERDRNTLMRSYHWASVVMDEAFYDLLDNTPEESQTAVEARSFHILNLQRVFFKASMMNPAAASDDDKPSRKEQQQIQDQLFDEVIDEVESLLISTSPSTIHGESSLMAAPQRVFRLGSETSAASSARSGSDAAPRVDSASGPSEPIKQASYQQPSDFSISEDMAPRPTQSPRSSIVNVPKARIATFAPDMSVLAPLLNTFLRTTNLRIRHRVIDVLRQSRRQEGIYDSALFVKICTRILQIERQGPWTQEIASSSSRAGKVSISEVTSSSRVREVPETGVDGEEYTSSAYAYYFIDSPRGDVTGDEDEETEGSPGQEQGKEAMRKVTGVKFGLANYGKGLERIRVGFIFDGGKSVQEEVL